MATVTASPPPSPLQSPCVAPGCKSEGTSAPLAPLGALLGFTPGGAVLKRGINYPHGSRRSGCPLPQRVRAGGFSSRGFQEAEPLSPCSRPLCHCPAPRPWGTPSRGAGVWHGEGPVPPPQLPGRRAASPEPCRGVCNAESFGQKTSWGFAPQPSKVTWRPAPSSAEKRKKPKLVPVPAAAGALPPCEPQRRQPWGPQRPPPLLPLLLFSSLFS